MMCGRPPGRHDPFPLSKGGPLARTNFNFEKRRKELEKKKKKEAKQLARQEKKAKGAADADQPADGEAGDTTGVEEAPESGPTP